MAGEIGALRVTLGANTANFEQGMRRASGVARRSGRDMENSYIRLTQSGVRAFSTLRTTILAAGAVIAANFIRHNLEMVGSLGEVSQQLGVTSRDLQVYRYIATQVGVSQEEMDRGLQRLTRSIGEAAHGVGNAGTIFERLGIQVRDAAGNIRTAGEIIPELADAIQRIPDAASRATALTRIFGRAGQQLAPLFEQGSRGIAEFTRRAEELGLVLSEGDIARADEAADKIDELSRALSANFSRVVADNAGAILGLANALESLAVGITRFLGSNPSRALAIILALAGARLGRVGGLPGMVAGGIGGAILGDFMGGTSSPINTETVRTIANFRMRQEMARRGIGTRLRRGTPEYNAAVGEMARDPQWRTIIAASRPPANDEAPAFHPAPGTDLGDLGGGGGGRHERDRSAQRQHQYEQEERSLQIDNLRAMEENAQTLDERTGILNQIAELENQQWLADQEFKLSQDEITQAQFDRLTELHSQLVTTEATGRALEATRRAHEQEQHIAEEQVQAQQETLRLHADLAETARERRRIELEILAVTYRARREALQRIIDQSQDPEAVARAQRGQADLPGRLRLEQQRVMAGTRGPLETLLAELPLSADKLNEALQNVAVNGLNAISEGLLDVITGAESMGKVFKRVASQIIADLLRIQIQKAILGPLANALSGLLGGAGAGAGGGFDPALKWANPFGGARAAGGPVLPARTYLIGEKGPELLHMGGTAGHVVANDNIGGGGSITIHQRFEFEGVAVTQEEFARGLLGTRTATIAAIEQLRRRRG